MCFKWDLGASSLFLLTCPLFLFSDAHSVLATVAEGVAKMLVPTLYASAKAFVDERLEVRQSATRMAPEMARRDGA